MSLPESTARVDGFDYNIRTLSAPQSGVQRYGRELNARFGHNVRRLAPSRSAQGIGGHLWEQFVLPWRCRGRMLFSPGNTGPLLCRDQVVTIHDASTFDCADAFTGLFGRWYRWLLPRLAQRALGIITISNFSRDRLVAALGIPAAKITVVYNGVTQPPPAPSELSRREVQARLKLPKKFLLFVGSRDPRKNLELLVAAFLLADLPDHHLVIAGGSNRQLFNHNLSTGGLEKVLMLGHVAEADLEVLYLLADGFVFPSLYEGFGLPPLEAMARGCPVLCSDASCLPEVCGPPLSQGGACLYFSPHRKETIAKALQEFAALSSETRKSMVEAGYRQAAKYNWNRCTDETNATLLHFRNASPRLKSNMTRHPEAAQRLLEDAEVKSR